MNFTFLEKFLKMWEYQTTLLVFWETFMQVKKQQNWTENNWLVQNREGGTTRLYVVTCLFNFCAGYIRRNTGLDESKAEIKIASNFRYADDTTLMAES